MCMRRLWRTGDSHAELQRRGACALPSCLNHMLWITWRCDSVTLSGGMAHAWMNASCLLTVTHGHIDRHMCPYANMMPIKSILAGSHKPCLAVPTFRLSEKVYPKVYKVNFAYCIEHVTESSDFYLKAHRVGDVHTHTCIPCLTQTIACSAGATGCNSHSIANQPHDAKQACVDVYAHMQRTLATTMASATHLAQRCLNMLLRICARGCVRCSRKLLECAPKAKGSKSHSSAK